MAPLSRLIDGPAEAAVTLLLAHGAGAAMDSPFMDAMAHGLANRGARVVRFEFPYMAKRRADGRQRAPDRLPKLLDAFRQQVAMENDTGKLVIGGKSMGGRLASLLVDELAAHSNVCGCLCLGYPFHPPGKPEQRRTTHLETLSTPTLILQGERDSFGRQGEVEGYNLSPAIAVQWITAGDHSFKPTRRSGLSEAGNWSQALEYATHFLGQVSR
ncbi:MAG: alpha/beta fold hydrolase [Synechococcaceae bacterium WB9_2_112]|nr:alpha/beta fold hydrolase [Synechococcaceae bacterium WB9_2_112]